MPPKSKSALADSGSAVLSGVALFLSYPGYNLYFLEWFAFVPLLFALERRSLRQSYLLGLLTGAVAVFGGFHWMADWSVIVLNFPFPLDQFAALAYAFCIGQIFGIIATLYQWIRRQGLFNDILIFPAVAVVVFSIFPMLFYFKLGDAQSYLLPAIQGIEFTGVYGLDFVIAAANILVFKMLRSPRDKSQAPYYIGAVIVLAVWFGYGMYALQNWDERIDKWELKSVGITQPNRPAQLTLPKPEKGYSRQYPLEMAMSRELAAKGADIVVWPEGHFYGYVYWTSVRQSFKALIKDMGIHFVIYDSTFEIRDNRKQFYNSSIWLNQRGEMAGIYHKMELVPFGEYTPVVGRLPFIKTLLGDYLSDLSTGTENKVFAIDGMKIVPKICYEPLFPVAMSKAIRENPDGKVFLVQSQDGWYGETSGPEQHMTVTALRAVENRTPLIHVINNGASAVILPNGRYAFRSPSFVKGAWIAKMPFGADSGGSFFSQYPYFFLGLVWTFFAVAALGRMGSLLFTTEMFRCLRKKHQ